MGEEVAATEEEMVEAEAEWPEEVEKKKEIDTGFTCLFLQFFLIL
jgi:hypothetical protein